MDKSVTQTRIQMRLKEAGMNIYSCYNNVMPPPPPPHYSNIRQSNINFNRLISRLPLLKGILRQFLDHRCLHRGLSLTLLALTLTAQAQTTETLVSNLAGTRPNTDADQRFQVGTKFTTGSSSKGYTPSDVQLWVKTGNANTVVSIRAGSGTNPGTLIATLTNPNSFTNDALNTFTAPANTVLNANTPYFLVVNDGVDDLGDRAEFSTTLSKAETGAKGWSIADSIRFVFAGSWTDASGVLSFAIRGQINPVPGVITAQPADTVVTEGDISDTANFTAVLNTEPTSAVTVTMTAPAGLVLDGPDGATAFTMSEMLTFATDAWDTPQTMTVRATDDNTDSQPQQLAVTYSTTSSDDDYSSLTGTAASVTVNDDDATVVSLARTGSTSTVSEGGTVEFTVTLGRALIAGEIIDVPLIVSGTNITTADWSLSRKSGSSLNTGVTLVNETTASPVVRFSGVGAQTATLTLTTTIDNMAETGGSEMLTLALGPDGTGTNGFDLNTRMTNVDGGADPNSDATKNTFDLTINDVDNEAPMPSLPSLEAINEQCELTKTQLDGMAPTATDNHPGAVTVTNNIGRFPIMSDTTITWTYTDAAGNTSTQTQQVTIMDTTPPSVTGTLNEVMEQCEVAVVTDLTVPTAADNCDSGAITATTDAAFPITSTTTITWTYRDAAGNTSTQMQQVTINDTTDPVPMVADLPKLEDCSQVTSLTAPTAADNCDGAIMGTTTVTPPITASTTITWTYTDAAGNAVTQTQEVVVNSDVLIPDVPSLPILTDQCRIAAISSPTAKNCSANTITATTTANLPITTNSTIMWMYSDAGNTAMQTQEVMIMDTMNPVPDNTLSALTAAGSLAQTEVTVPTATDNCDGQIMAVPDVTFPITSDTTITWTYTDAAGNTATQTQQVTITAAPLGVAEDVAEAVIFPNPSGDYLEVRSSIEGMFKVLSLSGKSLLEGTINTRVDITSLRGGLYLVQLPDGRLLKFVRE